VNVKGDYTHTHTHTHTHSRDSNDAVIKAFYIKYCKILNKVIQEAKNSIIIDL